LSPDALYGLNLHQADSVNWQTLSNDSVNQFRFVSIPGVSDLNSEFLLDGVEFGRPIGDCAGPFQAWEFPEPFLVANPPSFEPLKIRLYEFNSTVTIRNTL